MLYTDFVKINYTKVKHLPAKQRMSALAKLWKAHKADAHGSGYFKDLGSQLDDMDLFDDNEGAGLLSSPLSMLGLGLPVKKKRVAKKGKKSVKGAGLIDDALNYIGLGLPVEQKKKQPAKRGRKPKGSGLLLNNVARNPIEQPAWTMNGNIIPPRTHGSGFMSDFFDGVSKGLDIVPKVANMTTSLIPLAGLMAPMLM